MAGNDGFEIEKPLGRVSRAMHVHGKMPPRRQHPDIGAVQIGKNLHIGHHIGIARMINHMALARDHKPAFCARHIGAIGCGKAGGMHRMHHRYLWPAQINSATFVETDGFHTLCFGPMAHQIVLAHNRNIQRPRQAQHIDHMVKMGMG